MSKGKKSPHKSSNDKRAAKRISNISVKRATLIVAASVGLTLAFYFLFSRFPSVINVFSTATASVTAFAISIFGTPIVLNDTILEVNNYRFQLIPDCTPLPPILLLSGAILAFPADWQTKGIGILAGIVILSVLNLIRTVSLVYIGIYIPDWLDIAHNVIWQSVMILTGIGIFLVWLKRNTYEVHA